VPGLDLNALDGYVGVSAGGFIAAGLANGMTPRQLCARSSRTTARAPTWCGPRSSSARPGRIRAPRRHAAGAGGAGGAAATPSSGARCWRRSSAWAARCPPGCSARTAGGTAAPLLRAPGRSNDFRRLQRKLVLVATDLDSGEAAPFGQPGWDHVPISQAVAASAALPGLFPPVPIDGRWYVDGALKKTLHARVLLDMGLDLVLCLNPLVPFDASEGRRPPRADGARGRIPRLVDGGLPVVLAQTFRSLIHSRLELGMKGYESSHPGTDILLFEPDHRDPEMFLANTFGYSQRRCWPNMPTSRRAPTCARAAATWRHAGAHGLALDHAVLDDPQRHGCWRRSAQAAPQAAARARCGGWTRCWTTWKRAAAR
jgi:NTE family protein